MMVRVLHTSLEFMHSERMSRAISNCQNTVSISEAL